MSKWGSLTRRITAADADAEAEPEHERLFSRPPRWPAVLPKTIDTKRVHATMKEGRT